MDVASGITGALDQHYVKLVPVECSLSVTWLSCWGQSSRARFRFGQQPPLGLQQQVSLRVAGGEVWLMAAQSHSQDGCWNGGMCNTATAAGKLWLIMLVWRAAKL